ncbi:MAG: caspase family protein [Candidatus Pacebacteria bacterium]|nr:caspase family protein [Candidatus Paceibacterota bacterium]
MKKALIVGINNYPTSPLRGCINDASAFSTIMEKNADGSPNFSVKLETDVPTKAKLKSLIVDLFSGDSDIALFYFSGHGFLNEIGGYIVTPDYTKYDEGVAMEEILNIANKSKAKDKIIILDCCHSGAFGSPIMTGGATAQIIEGVVVLTASKSDGASIEVNGHGVFTNLLLDALQGGASNLLGEITPGSVYAYIDQALGPWDQRPVFKTNVTRFTSLRKINPLVPLEILRKIIEYFPTPDQEHALDPTYEFDNKDIAKPEKVTILKNLQKFERVGLVVPVGEEHMYYAAQNSKSCKLTALGYHYWRLVKDKKI